MAKREKIPKTILSQFTRVHFKVDDLVIFNWLSSKKYGYVKKIKKLDSKVTYYIKSNGYTYPVGIRLSKYQSHDWGWILRDETVEFGTDFIRNKINGARSATTNIQSNDGTGSKGISEPITDNGRKDDVLSSTKRNTTKKRKPRAKKVK